MSELWLVLALSAPAVLVAVVLALLLLRRKAHERKAVEALLVAVKGAEAEYRNALLTRLGGDVDDPAADKLVKQRRQYFKQVLQALLDRRPTGLLVLEPALRQFSEVHVQLLASRQLAAAPVSGVAEPAPATAANTGRSDEPLRAENDRLRREVGLTLSALNNIFAEYASMFGDEHTRRDMSLEEILHSMQQLAAGEPPAPVELPPDDAVTETGLSEPDTQDDPFASADAAVADSAEAPEPADAPAPNDERSAS